MKIINTVYIDGGFVAPHGRETLALLDPATEAPMTTVILADEVDAQRRRRRGCLAGMVAHRPRSTHGLAAAPARSST